jgi:hypothetical protein
MIKTTKKIYFLPNKNGYMSYIYHIDTYSAVKIPIYGQHHIDSNIYNVMIFHLKTGGYVIV